MDNVTSILSGLIGLALVLMIAPSVVAMNRGKTLRNVAAWLAIFLFLGLVYQHTYDGQDWKRPSTTSLSAPQEKSLPNPSEKTSEQPSSEEDNDQGYMPPKD